MKKSIIIAILILVMLSSCMAGTKDNKKSLLDTILETGVLKIGTTGDFKPMSYIDVNTQKYIGHDIDLVEQLAADMGVKVEYVKTDWKNLVSGISTGLYHTTNTASFNVGRAKVAGYTLPVTKVGTVPITLKVNVAKYKSWNDINKPSVKVATTLGTVFEEQVTTLLPNAKIIKVESPARDFQEVLAGRVDVSVTSNIEAASLIKEYPELALVPVPVQFANALGLLAPRGDQEFINFLNVWITTKTASGYLTELDKKWGLIN